MTRFLPGGTSRYPATVLRALALLCLGLRLTGCAPADQEGSAVDMASLSQEELGRLLFTTETFDGNGRVCSTCHVLENFGTLSPEFVQARWEEDPSDPLFRSIDSDDGIGDAYTRLLEHATVRVPIPLGVHEPFGLSVRRCDAPADTTVWLNRGNPSVFNIALDMNLMVDGRDGPDLPIQARNAVNTHAQPGRQPTQEELEAIAAFQRTLFSNGAVRRFLEAGDSLRLPEGRTPAEIRGREFFEPNGACGVCHSGPMLNQTSVEHPDGPGHLFEAAGVGLNPDNPNPNPAHDWCWVDPATDEIVEGPNGSTRVNPEPIPDPGAALLPGYATLAGEGGVLGEVPRATVLTIFGNWFKLPTLWGSPDTAPYFHDNSAKDLFEVLDHYNFVFSTFPEGVFDIGCEFQDPECMSQEDKEDIVAFMQLLSFEGPAGVAAETTVAGEADRPDR